MRLTQFILLIVGMAIGTRGSRAQPFGNVDPESGLPGNFVRLEGGMVVNEDELRTARQIDSHSTGTPNWTNASGFELDVFTFARVIFKSDPNPRSRRGRLRWLGWWVDYPDADLNLSYRLQQMTSIKTDPDARVLKLTDPHLSTYPLLYMEHAGYMRLSEEETTRLRDYLLSGGALFVNDFWGAEEWEGFAHEIGRVLPNHSWIELTMDHPVFHCVYDLSGSMKRLQIPTMQFWNAHYDPENPKSPQQTVFRGEGSEEMHVRAILDDRQRIMILAIHNSDVSDGWEREQENELYFNQYSERVAYPLGINIIFYLMTH
ncbi:MAG TPA: DUF4159 domain-containing protein [Verrucomicrobiota bacterium]|nr:transmembrane prediction [Verrucomicrobiales bacterium]HRI16717.1 DUF4159 domain-containing protein [Verrucomicrobiota bacterium]